MNRKSRIGWLALICLAAASLAVAQAYRPIVEMAVTLPGGKTKTLSAPESGLAVVTVASNEFGFRPTIVDAKPWNHVVVTVFKMASQNHATQELCEIDLRTGAAAMASKTSPSFKVAVTKVRPPATITTRATS